MPARKGIKLTNKRFKVEQNDHWPVNDISTSYSDARYFKKGITFKQKLSYNNYFGFTDQLWRHGASVNCDVMSGQHYYWASSPYFVYFCLSMIPFSIYFDGDYSLQIISGLIWVLATMVYQRNAVVHNLKLTLLQRIRDLLIIEHCLIGETFFFASSPRFRCFLYNEKNMLFIDIEQSISQ